MGIEAGVGNYCESVEAQFLALGMKGPLDAVVHLGSQRGDGRQARLPEETIIAGRTSAGRDWMYHLTRVGDWRMGRSSRHSQVRDPHDRSNRVPERGERCSAMIGDRNSD